MCITAAYLISGPLIRWFVYKVGVIIEYAKRRLVYLIRPTLSKCSKYIGKSVIDMLHINSTKVPSKSPLLMQSESNYMYLSGRLNTSINL